MITAFRMHKKKKQGFHLRFPDVTAEADDVENLKSHKTLKTCRIPRLTQSKPEAIWKCKDRTRTTNASLFPLAFFEHRSFFFLTLRLLCYYCVLQEPKKKKTQPVFYRTPSAAFHRWENLLQFTTDETWVEADRGEKAAELPEISKLRSEGATLMAVEAIWMWCSLRRVLSLSMK